MSAVPPDLQCSLILFLATSAEEEGMLEAAKGHGVTPGKRRHPALGEYHWFGQVGDEVVMAPCLARQGGRVVMGAHGRLGTAARGLRFREATGAQGIVQLGMAFGVDRDAQRLGDVLVSTSLLPYDERVARDHPKDDGRYMVDYADVACEPARPELVDRFRREYLRTQVERSYRIHFGAMLSGAARIHSAFFRDELVRGVPSDDPIVGGEMEGVGLLAASRGADDPVWCIVKGISDFADAERDRDVAEARAAACRNAADFVFSALRNDQETPT